LDDNKVQEIIGFINTKNNEVPRPVKFVLKRKTMKIERLDPNDFP